jgi:spore germination protein GerM
LAASSIVETLTALPGIDAVALSVEGQPWGPPGQRTPLLYFSSPKGLVAVPVSATSSREAVLKFLVGPTASGTIGLPSDVRLLKYDYDPSARSVSLNFTYTPSLRDLALETPDRMRAVLLGLIASLTEFREVASVQIDFEGHSRLGVGQCSDLLRTRQPRPELLNDERLLGR